MARADVSMTDPCYRNRYLYITSLSPGKSKLALLYGMAMNAGKTVSQEMLSYGQGADRRKHMLFVIGESPHSVGTTV